MFVYDGECRRCGKKCSLCDNDMGGSHKYDGVCWECERSDYQVQNEAVDAMSIEERLKKVEETLGIRHSIGD